MSQTSCGDLVWPLLTAPALARCPGAGGGRGAGPSALGRRERQVETVVSGSQREPPPLFSDPQAVVRVPEPAPRSPGDLLHPPMPTPHEAEKQVHHLHPCLCPLVGTGAGGRGVGGPSTAWEAGRVTPGESGGGVRAPGSGLELRRPPCRQHTGPEEAGRPPSMSSHDAAPPAAPSRNPCCLCWCCCCSCSWYVGMGGVYTPGTWGRGRGGGTHLGPSVLPADPPVPSQGSPEGRTPLPPTALTQGLPGLLTVATAPTPCGPSCPAAPPRACRAHTWPGHSLCAQPELAPGPTEQGALGGHRAGPRPGGEGESIPSSSLGWAPRSPALWPVEGCRGCARATEAWPDLGAVGT